MPSFGRRIKRFGAGCLVSIIAIVLLIAFTGPGQVIRDLWRNGILQGLMQGGPDRKYAASEQANLKAIYTALMLYHDSEGQFPEARGWMDAIRNRLTTSDMKSEESAKKLIRPDVEGQPGAYGYAMNDRASGKYSKDLEPKMPLVFDSKDLSKNAHGNPDALLPYPKGSGRNVAIAVDGTILKL